MQNMWDLVLHIWAGLLIWMVVFAGAFSLCAHWMPCNPGQPLWRKGMLTDVIYYFMLPIFSNFARVVFISAGVYLIFYNKRDGSALEYIKNGFGTLGEIPLWGQIAITFILSDLLLYWIHRAFHEAPMWKYHAIHHSSEHVDWLSTYRFHPINTFLSFALADSVMLLIGFSPAAIAAMSVFNTIYSAMVHANLNWTFGPFRYVFASPVFHRWHHTAQEEGMNKNFAPTIPLIDVIFGTFYMPEKKLPEHFGVRGSDIPHGFIGQLIWPFTTK